MAAVVGSLAQNWQQEKTRERIDSLLKCSTLGATVDDMVSIGIRELRQHASRYVAMAKEGARISVTNRGKRVAYLVSAEKAGSVVDRLEASGQYQRARGSIVDLGPPPPTPSGVRPLSEVIAEMRDAERQ